MVKAFQFAHLPRIFFGIGKAAGLPELIRSFGNNIVLLTGKRSFVNSAEGEKIISGLKKDKIRFHHFEIPGEPSPGMIDLTVQKLKGEAVDVVVAIGGGSVLDAGKAVSAMLHEPGDIIDYLEDVGTKAHSGRKVPFIALPTTSGTGSEATKNAVITKRGHDGFKKSLRHENFVPDIAVIDPILTISCPPGITAAGGLDCFTQLFEAFLSGKSSEYTDALALEGLKAVKRSLYRCFLDGNDREARSDMSFAALTSGICLANAGLGAVHGFAGTIGGLFDIPHGVICGTLMAAANEMNVKVLRSCGENHPALTKYTMVGRIFSDIDGRSDDYYIDAFIQYLHKITNDLNMQRLGSYGLTENDIHTISINTDIKNNPVRLETDDLANILKDRL